MSSELLVKRDHFQMIPEQYFSVDTIIFKRLKMKVYQDDK